MFKASILTLLASFMMQHDSLSNDYLTESFDLDSPRNIENYKMLGAAHTSCGQPYEKSLMRKIVVLELHPKKGWKWNASHMPIFSLKMPTKDCRIDDYGVYYFDGALEAQWSLVCKKQLFTQCGVSSLHYKTFTVNAAFSLCDDKACQILNKEKLQIVDCASTARKADALKWPSEQ